MPPTPAPYLPGEIDLIIAGYCAEHDLSALARTSRQYYDRFKPILYAIAVERNRIPVLHWAAEHGSIEVAKNALAAGAKPNQLWYSEFPKYMLDQVPILKVSALDLDSECKPLEPRLSFLMNEFNGPRELRERRSLFLFAQECWASGDTLGWLEQDNGDASNPNENEVHRYEEKQESLRNIQHPRDHLQRNHDFQDYRWAPLHLAVYYGHSNLVELLLSHGAEPNMPSEGVCSCHDWAGDLFGGYGTDTQTPVRLSLSGSVPLHLAICASRYSIFKLLANDATLIPAIESLRSPQWRESYPIKAYTLDEWRKAYLSDPSNLVSHHLVIACACGDLEAVKCLLENLERQTQEADLKWSFLRHYALWYCAVRGRSWSVLDYLVEAVRNGPTHKVTRLALIFMTLLEDKLCLDDEVAHKRLLEYCSSFGFVHNKAPQGMNI